MNASGTEAPCAHSGILLIPLLDCRSEIKGLASVTGRIGYSFGNALLYGKGGGAWIRDRYAVSHHIQPQIGEFYAATETRFGWTVGTGLEYAFVPNWSAFAEYDYYDFGTRSVLLAVTGNPLITVEVPPTFQIRQSMNVVKAGINYRFGGFTP
jgi:outer membrane immunogenic protein